MNLIIRILDRIDEMKAVEDLQALVWPESERDIVPDHMLLTAAHNGGLVIGAYLEDANEVMTGLVGFVFGFPGLYLTPDGPRPKHCSHMMGVLPKYRDLGIGFKLKRAQWQMVRHQGLDRITWTYDPLLSRNAYLNITKLGAVSNTYLQELYGDMRDGLNLGLPSDRFQVDWWVNSRRVYSRLDKKPRGQLDLAHFIAGGVEVINPTKVSQDGWSLPPAENPAELAANFLNSRESLEPGPSVPMLMVEIPADFMGLKASNPNLALVWRNHSRSLFVNLFERGYIVTDFVYLPGMSPRSYYVLSHGESTL